MCKTKTNRAIAILLALVLSLAIAAPAFAVEAESDNPNDVYDLLPTTGLEVDPPDNAEEADFWMPYHNVTNNTWTLSKGEDEVLAEIKNKALQLTEKKTTETAKAYAIFRWVASNIKYDYANMRQWVAGDALYVYDRRKGICEGYSNLSCLMLAYAGLPAARATGIARKGGGHAWNAVYADGKWIVFDATWDEWNIGSNFHSVTKEIQLPLGQLLLEFDSSSGDIVCDTLPGYKQPNHLVIPSCATSIEGSPLRDYTNVSSVTSVTIPESVTSIGDYAFERFTGLTSVDIPKSVTSIGNSAFRDCTGLTSVTIPDSVTSIGSSAFSGCTGLTSVTIPESVTSIGAGAFRDCTGLTSVDIPESVTEINNSTFYGCSSLTSVNLPESVTKIGGYSFSGCSSLTSVTIPESVTSIGDDVFRDCTGLTSVELPSSLTQIGQGAFKHCPNLEAIYFAGTEEQWNSMQNKDAFSGGHVTIYYNTPIGSDKPSVPDPKPAETPVVADIDFVDVAPDAWYAEAVNWAIAKGITNGTSETTFSPLDACTRSQIITFLYRANGSPAVSSEGQRFSDVTSSDWYYNAAIWAAQNGLVTGTTFYPNVDATRADVVRYLYRLAGKPDVDGANGFSDVPADDAELVSAVAWAIGKGITNGTSESTFSPDKTCNRAEIVTFLYRAYK